MISESARPIAYEENEQLRLIKEALYIVNNSNCISEKSSYIDEKISKKYAGGIMSEKSKPDHKISKKEENGEDFPQSAISKPVQKLRERGENG